MCFSIALADFLLSASQFKVSATLRTPPTTARLAKREPHRVGIADPFLPALFHSPAAFLSVIPVRRRSRRPRLRSSRRCRQRLPRAVLCSAVVRNPSSSSGYSPSPHGRPLILSHFATFLRHQEVGQEVGWWSRICCMHLIRPVLPRPRHRERLAAACDPVYQS